MKYLILFSGPYQYRASMFSNIYEDIHPSEIKDGFTLIFHDPFEVPTESSVQVQTLPNRKINFLVTPELISVDESLFAYSPEE